MRSLTKLIVVIMMISFGAFSCASLHHEGGSMIREDWSYEEHYGPDDMKVYFYNIIDRLDTVAIPRIDTIIHEFDTVFVEEVDSFPIRYPDFVRASWFDIVTWNPDSNALRLDIFRIENGEIEVIWRYYYQPGEMKCRVYRDYGNALYDEIRRALGIPEDFRKMH